MGEKEKLAQVNKILETLSVWEEGSRSLTTRADQLIHEIGKEALLEKLSEVSRQLTKPWAVLPLPNRTTPNPDQPGTEWDPTKEESQ